MSQGNPPDTDTIHLALALLGHAITGQPCTGIDMSALNETSPLELRAALGPTVTERLAALAEDIDWTGYTAPLNAGYPIDLTADVSELTYRDTGYTPHWAERLAALTDTTIEVSGFWDRTAAPEPDDSGSHYLDPVTKHASRDLNTRPGWFESGDLPRTPDPRTVPDPNTPVWNTGQTISDLMATARSEIAEYTSAGGREPHTPGVSERGRTSPFGPIAYDGPPLRRVRKIAHVCGPRCVCPTHGTDLLFNAHTCEHACQDPGCEYASGMYWPGDEMDPAETQDRRGRAPTIGFTPVPEPVDDEHTKIMHRLSQRADARFEWVQNTTAPISSDARVGMIQVDYVDRMAPTPEPVPDRSLWVRARTFARAFRVRVGCRIAGVPIICPDHGDDA